MSPTIPISPYCLQRSATKILIKSKFGNAANLFQKQLAEYEWSQNLASYCEFLKTKNIFPPVLDYLFTELVIYYSKLPHTALASCLEHSQCN